ncbi:MAG: hypothetical protein QM668_17620 [Agriterribacter sp.]
MNWCAVSDGWHTPSATNELRAGGKLTTGWKQKKVVSFLILEVYMTWLNIVNRSDIYGR